MSEYTTRQGDMWDGIAFLIYGTTDVTDRLIAANPEYSDVYIFNAGTVLRLPEITVASASQFVPAPWKGGAIG